MHDHIDASARRGRWVGESASSTDGPPVSKDGSDCRHLGQVGPSIQIGKQDSRALLVRDSRRHGSCLQRPLSGFVGLQVGRVDVQQPITDVDLRPEQCPLLYAAVRGSSTLLRLTMG